MQLEKLNQQMFEQISFDEMSNIHGGNEPESPGGTTLTCITSTGSCGCVDAGDVD